MNIQWGFSAKKDGNMAVAIDGVLQEDGRKNRERFFQKIEAKHFVVCKLVHGKNVQRVTLANDQEIIDDCDGLTTDAPKLFLGITGADCFPLYFFNSDKTVVGLAHAGWRGILKGIVPAMVTHLMQEYQVSPSALHVIIGPGIRACHFEIQTDVLPQFSPYTKFIQHNKKITVDLPGILKYQLQSSHVSPDHINDTQECTFCGSETFFSFRRDGAPLQVHLAYIGLCPKPSFKNGKS